MKRTILVLTLTLLLSSTATVRGASSASGSLNAPGGNITGESAAIFPYGTDNPPQPLATTSFIISLVALLY